MTAARPRDDILVSIGLCDVSADERGIALLAGLAREMAGAFRYWELLVAVDGSADRHQRLLAQVPNLRLLKVRPGASFYHRRFAVASEAIGDVVVLAALAELPYLDLAGMAADAQASGALVIGQHAGANPLGPAASALGRSAGLRIGAHDMVTMAWPRPALNIVLTHPDRLLALRFPPVDERLAIRHQPCRDAPGLPRFRGGSDSGPKLARRLNLLHRLMIGSAPRVLSLLALAALVTMVAGLLFAIYSVIVWATFAHVQPGWFTTALALSLTAGFLGGAVFGLSIGLQRLLESVAGDGADVVVDEIAAIDLFGKVMDEFNVEIETGRA